MERKRYYIIISVLVEWLQGEGFPLLQPSIKFYPDGSLWTDDYNSLRWTRESIINGRLYRQPLGVEMMMYDKLPGACGSAAFRPLGPFGGDHKAVPYYTILYPGSCDWMGGRDSWVLAYPGIFGEVREEEYDLSKVRVLVKQRRKFTQAVAEELAGTIFSWFIEVGSAGVFGEKGIGSIEPTMHYLNDCAGFVLNARDSGQETLNTLYLAIMNWGISKRRSLVLMDMAASENEEVFVNGISLSLNQNE